MGLVIFNSFVESVFKNATTKSTSSSLSPLSLKNGDRIVTGLLPPFPQRLTASLSVATEPS